MKTLKKLILACSLIATIGLFTGCVQLLDAYTLSQNSWYSDQSMPGIEGYTKLDFNYDDLTFTVVVYKEGSDAPYAATRGKWIVEPDTETGKSILSMTTTDARKGGLGDVEVDASDDSQWLPSNEITAKYNFEVTSSSLILKAVGSNSSDTWSKYR